MGAWLTSVRLPPSRSGDDTNHPNRIVRRSNVRGVIAPGAARRGRLNTTPIRVPDTILDGAFVRLLQVLVEDNRIMRGSARIEGIPRNRPRGGPSTIPIQALRRISPLRVQCQETEPGSPRRVLDGLHQLSAQPHAAAAAMYQQLRNLRVMR